MTDKSVNCGTPICYYNPQDAACKGSTDPNAATCAGAPNSNVCTAEGLCFSNCKFQIFVFPCLIGFRSLMCWCYPHWFQISQWLSLRFSTHWLAICFNEDAILWCWSWWMVKCLAQWYSLQLHNRLWYIDLLNLDRPPPREWFGFRDTNDSFVRFIEWID